MISFLSFKKKETSQYLFDGWVETLIQNENPSAEIIAINFGIFESEKGYKLYLGGFKEYDENNDDWAVGLGDFSPCEKYFTLPKRDFKKLNWDEVQENVAELIRNYMNKESYKDSFLDKATAITTGFDEGDLLKIK
jgi:hypothetical protein